MAMELIGGVGIMLLGLIVSGSAGVAQVYGIDGWILLSVLGFIAIVLGSLQIFLARSVRRHARWAYVVALVVALLACAPRLLFDTPAELTNQTAITVWWIDTWIYVFIAIATATLLVASYVRRPVE